MSEVLFQKNVKICVVGDGAVGKTCLLHCYTKNEFPTEYIPTVFDNYATMVMCDGEVINLQLWDTAGQEDYNRLRPLSYPNTNAFLVCFSIIAKNSYENVKQRWVPELRHHCKDVPIILVGTKTDLRYNTALLKELNVDPISTKEGESLAKDIKASCYIECSSKTMDNVNVVFDKAIRAAIKPKKKNKGKKRDRVCVIL